MKRSIFLTVLCLCSVAFNQKSDFDVTAYRQFLDETKTIDATGLMQRYPAGLFQSQATGRWQNTLYNDVLNKQYNLTDSEKALIDKNGFMVSERLSFTTFLAALDDIYKKDLPLFLSADAFLHSVHCSYDLILKITEIDFLYPRLKSCLFKLHTNLPNLADRHRGQLKMQNSLQDIDLYLCVARNLLNDRCEPVFSENKAALSELYHFIATAQPASYPLFGETRRDIDFSQFTVRGHYTDTVHTELARYFQAMIWLSRTEFYLIAPEQLGTAPGFSDMQRQIMDAILLAELVELAQATEDLSKIDQVLNYFVGESDNVTLQNLNELKQRNGIVAAEQLLDSLQVIAFQDTLSTCSFAGQRINSQILWSDPSNPEQAAPASAFLLLGQRFVVDSYITGQVVFDKIVYDNRRVTRMLPSTLDVLFGLGNNAAGQLLETELQQYHYGPNLAAVRYLVDGYDKEFWASSYFNQWLGAIRALNPPADRSTLPPTMQTAAWWQRVMNTQLASWAELRHDNLLYAKQSYTMAITCSYPRVYVEPAPKLFSALRDLSRSAEQKFTEWSILPYTIRYFKTCAAVYDTLYTIAEKTSKGQPQSEQDKRFLQSALYRDMVCNTRGYNGWFPDLYLQAYDYQGMSDGLMQQDYIVADIHTSPTDENAHFIGWVQHVGTGPINLAIMILPQEGRDIAFVGPMMSYYEHLTTNFHRLTDEEWQSLYNRAPSLRPDFCNIYLADADGHGNPGGRILMTDVADDHSVDQRPQSIILAANYPNPFNATTLIHVVIPYGLKTEQGRLVVYDCNGREVCALFNGPVTPGHYLARWDGCDQNGHATASGVYFYRFNLGKQVVQGKMSLVR